MTVRTVAVFVGSGLALGVLVLGGWRVSTMDERDLEGMREHWLFDDKDSVRQLLALIVARGDLPMRDGALDPYYFVRNGEIAGRNVDILRSKRLGIGPTGEEIRRGDYTNFPWERYRGEHTNIGPPFFPLLWGRLNAKGWTLVGFSDGSVILLERDELKKWALVEPGDAQVSAAVAFLHMVLRDTWPSVAAILCGVYVDGARPRGTCGTHAEIIAVPLFLAALALSAATIVTSLLRIVRRRSAATAVSTVVNAYAVTVALVLALPYA